MDFTIPGQVILDDGQSIKGSSVSTALASGLAALILFCVGTSKYADPYFRNLHRKAHMERVFRRLTWSDRPSGAKLIRVRNYFHGFKELDWNQKGAGALDNLVQNLLQYGPLNMLKTIHIVIG